MFHWWDYIVGKVDGQGDMLHSVELTSTTEGYALRTYADTTCNHGLRVSSGRGGITVSPLLLYGGTMDDRDTTHMALYKATLKIGRHKDMAFVDTVDSDNTDVMDNGQTEQPVHIDLPNWDSQGDTDLFFYTLDTLGHARGVKTLKKYAHKYLDAIHIAARHMQQVITSLNTVNGVASPRTGTPGLSNELRKFKRASKTYFGGLSTPDLRKQCELFGLDYDSYDTMDEAIGALVDANVAKRNM